jgi:hypothetical protein
VPPSNIPLNLIYEIGIPAYLGVLAIVIAFAVLVVGKNDIKDGEYLRTAIKSLTLTLVTFACISIAGMLLGTEINGEIKLLEINMRDFTGDSSTYLSLARILIAEVEVLSIAVGLWYLQAVVKDFLDCELSASNKE